MAKLARWIEPKPTVSAHEAVPFVLLPLARRPAIAISAQIIPGSVFVDGQSLQSNMNSNREALRQKLATRPARGYLVQRGILFASSADSLIQKKAEVLKRCKLKDKLNKKLQHRPGPLELVTKKILQADAELEQAIQEGRILFTKTSDVVERETHSQQQLPYAAMEVISTTSACSPNSKSSNSGVAKSKVRKKTHQCRTPYEQTPSSPSCAKPKLKVATSPGASKDDESTQVQSSYDLLLQQQRLFLQWQKEVEDARGNSSQAAKEEGRFSSGQEDQIRGSPSEGCSMSEASPCAVQLTGSAHSNGEYAYDGDSRTLMCEQPVVELCCQSSAAASTTNETSSAVVVRPSSTAYSERDKPKLKLSDYRVQDLKNECKKRQLPVSGAKPQLVERLKPFEEAILGANADDVVRDVLSTTSPASEWSNGAKRLPPISNVINDYIQQNFTQVPQQMTQLQPLVLHVPAVSQNQQLLHKGSARVWERSQVAESTHISLQIFNNTKPALVDSNGSLVAMATVPGGVQCCRVSPDCPCDTQGVGTAMAHYGGSERTELPAQAATSVQTEPTFSFAQLGSGGQFTLVQSASSGEANRQSRSPAVLDDPQQCSTQCVIACPQLQTCGAQLTRAGCCSVQPASANVQPCGGTVLGAVQSTQFGSTSTNTQLVSANQTQIVPAQSIQMLAQPLQLSSGQLVPTTAVSSSQPCFVTPGAANDSIQYTHYVVSVGDQLQSPRQDGTLQAQCARCLPMRTAVPPPGCSPVTGDSASGSSPNIPSPPTKLDSATRSQDIHAMQIDPNDTNALLSATTLSIHEEMLRFQQRKIEELQKELNRSQQQLKHQQQVILAAKRAQTNRHECAQQKNEGEQSQADMWLNQLDIKHLNKFHIQLFLQHKLQQQQMQEQLLEQQKLTTTEQKLQEELHVEQAVQDIVRLIKQDARTALLIVQLLRRYQLERGRQAANAAVIAVNGDRMNSANNLADEQQHEQRQAVICTAESSAASNSEEIVDDVNVKKASAGIGVEEDGVASATSSTHSKPKSKKKNVASRCGSSKAEVSDRKEKAPAAQVDMEEIFRKVLEDASRALLLSNSDKEDETASGPSSEEVLDTHSNGQPSDTHQHEQQQVLFSSEAPQKPHSHGQFADSFAPVQSSPAFFVEEEKMSSECMDERYKERVEVIEEGAVIVDQPMQYSKNQAFDDLMDVLRDDQVAEADVRRPEHDFATGADYESNELATLLDGGWFDNESVAQSSVAYEAPCVGYAHDGPNELTEDMDSRDGAEHNDSVMGCFEPNQLSDQNINMDWLDMMLPSPAHENMGVQPLYNQMVADADILG
uniref:SAP domain-containing protein n=1 Tax=Parascaris univalens TaxID=6257 RepID=A0A915C9B7_PARUN